MDIFSHGLYGGIAFGRKSKRSYWTAFFFGIFPDLASFGVLFISILVVALLTGELPGGFSHHAPSASSIPAYVSSLYNMTHSFVVFGLLFGLVFLIRKNVLWEMCAWPLHIFVDIFTHSKEFFPTPFLWPISEYSFNGYSWGHPIIFIPNVLLLSALYAYWWHARKKNRTTVS